jgi:hypothetical protein
MGLILGLQNGAIGFPAIIFIIPLSNYETGCGI